MDETSKLSIVAENETSLKSLTRAIELAKGRRFSLILAQCNYADLRSEVISYLNRHSTAKTRIISLSPKAKTLYTTIKSELGEDLPEALIINNLEHNEHIDDLLL